MNKPSHLPQIQGFVVSDHNGALYSHYFFLAPIATYSDDNTASIKISTPMPPIPWVELLQNRIPWSNDSISFNMLAKMVLKLDTDSNNASIIEGIAPLIR